MEPKALVDALSAGIPVELAQDLVSEFVSLRVDVASRRLGGSAPGKFVESLVQALQFLDSGSYSSHPDVDKELRGFESRTSNVPDGLRICATRVARAMYSLRSKRNISHKGEVDPNSFDLGFLHAGAQWVMAELLRTITDVSMEDAGRLIAQVLVPVGGVVEDLGSRRLVLADLSVRDELLVLLQSHYPSPVVLAEIVASMDRRDASGVRRAVRELWKKRLLAGEAKAGYRLTERGVRGAAEIVKGIARGPD